MTEVDGDVCKSQFALSPRGAGEMSRSDRGGGTPDRIPRCLRSRPSRPPSAFGISPPQGGGEKDGSYAKVSGRGYDGSGRGDGGVVGIGVTALWVLVWAGVRRLLFDGVLLGDV